MASNPLPPDLSLLWGLARNCEGVDIAGSGGLERAVLVCTVTHCAEAEAEASNVKPSEFLTLTLLLTLT